MKFSLGKRRLRREPSADRKARHPSRNGDFAGLIVSNRENEHGWDGPARIMKTTGASIIRLYAVSMVSPGGRKLLCERLVQREGLTSLLGVV
jgi:hypothetical protein